MGRVRAAWALAAALLAAPASAHVTLSPADSPASRAQRYDLWVHADGDVATTAVELEIPPGVTVIGVIEQEGVASDSWKEDGRITRIRWRRTIRPGQTLDFHFIARDSAISARTWKAHQYAADGAVTAWVGAPDARRPASAVRFIEAR
jgi:uncharacterized protein YcnI